jgi:integrase
LPRLKDPTKIKPKKAKSRGNGRGTVWEDPPGSGKWRWQITLGFDKQGKRITASGTHPAKGLAERALAAAITDHARGELPAPNLVTVREYATRWLGRKRDLAPASVRRYTRELEYLFNAKTPEGEFGGLRMQSVSKTLIVDAMTNLADREMNSGLGAERTMSASTLSSVRVCLRSFFDEAVEDGILRASPARRVKRVKPLRTEHPGIALDFPEYDFFLDLGNALEAAGKCSLWVALFLCATLGPRKGEVMGLQVGDLDLKTQRISIARSLTSIDGHMHLGPTKNDGSTRVIPMTPTTVEVLKRYLEELQARADACGYALRQETPLFPSADWGFRDPNSLNRALTALLTWSNPSYATKNTTKRTPDAPAALESRLRGIPEKHRDRIRAVLESRPEGLPRISPHDLRHTAGTLMLRSGMDVAVVSAILGHNSPVTTYRVYRKVIEAEKRSSIVDLGARHRQPKPDGGRKKKAA